jgi:hypothetical protein
MAPTNFHLAPPSKVVDGLLAVPIDIQSIDAKLVFDGAAQSGSADATIAFTVGPTAGNPIFDLRQTITNAWLDGAPFPAAQVALHDFGGGALSELRMVQSVLNAGSVHTLRLQYTLGIPASQLGGAYPPALEWSPGPKLRFSFGLSDLNAGRYLEAWLPANLIFDQFSIHLDVEVINTVAGHSVITNGQVTGLGTNHWAIDFPARFTALSPLLELRASDSLQSQSGAVALPVSGLNVAVEAWKLSGAAFDLAAQINLLKNFLVANENDYGPYVHGNRFVAFFNVGGMEYEGGTTTSASALLHETFHSWFARGIKPSGQEHGWWDEAFTSFHDDGADDALPFDFSAPTITLCSRDPWQRRTPSNSYTDGNRFWKGMAALVGVATLNDLMSDCYKRYRGDPVSTQMIEEFLLSKNGNPQIVDAFHRFVYGFPDPSPAPQLWLKDDAAHTGADVWSGAFWDSPDLWVRNQDDGGTAHQAPEHGQDNWFYARIRNKNTAGACKHFAVTFQAKPFAGTEFVYPADFLPCVAAKVEFDLAPGATRIVKAKWPRAQIPAAGTHTCLLASVIARKDHPASGLHVWEHANLAQKNLTIVDLKPNTFVIIPVVLRNVRRPGPARHHLEIWRDPALENYEVSLLTRSADLLAAHRGKRRRVDWGVKPAETADAHELLDCGAHPAASARAGRSRLLTADAIDLVAEQFSDATEVQFPKGKKATISVELPSGSQTVVGLKITLPQQAAKGAVLKTHFVQRHVKTRRITGGIAAEIRVR